MPKQIVFSDRAMTALLVETYEKIKTETGGVFLGYRKGDVWYVVETIDPGPDSIFRTAYFEYDQAYINHLINKISRLYREQLDLIGLWHRHPGSLDEFSSTDDGTNKQYAQLDKDGAVSALVNIDPTFRLTVYEVKEPLSYKKINYVVGDENIPVHLLGYVSQKLLTSKINDTSNQVPGKPKASFSNLLKQYQKQASKGDIRIEIEKELIQSKETTCDGLTFGIALHEYLKKRTIGNVVVRDITKVDSWPEDRIENILEALSVDLEYLPSIGIDCKMTVNENGFLELSEIIPDGSKNKCPIKLIFDKLLNSVVFKYNEYTYQYHPCMFQESFNEFAKGAK